MLKREARIETFGDGRQPGIGHFRLQRERRGIPRGVWKMLAIMAAISVLGGVAYAIYESRSWIHIHTPQLSSAPFIGVGLFLIGWSLKLFTFYVRSLSFLSTPGRLLQAEIGSGKGSFFQIGSSRSGSRGFAPAIVFEYKVNGVSYLSDKLRSAPLEVLKHRSEDVQQFLDRLSAEPALTVYYDPRDPSVAFLQHSLLGVLVPLLTGLLFAGFGFFFWIQH